MKWFEMQFNIPIKEDAETGMIAQYVSNVNFKCPPFRK